MKRLHSFLLILLGGVCYGFSFPPFDLHLLVFVSLAIFLLMIKSSKGILNAGARAYLMFLSASIVAISWISMSGMQENADRFLIFAGLAVLIVYPLFFVPTAMVMKFIFRTFDSGKMMWIPLAAFPFVWTAFEYMSTWGQITFPWLLAGNTQTSELTKIQFIEYTGVYGISFWICAVSIYLFMIISNLNLRKSPKGKMLILGPLAVAVALYFVPDIISKIIKTEYDTDGKAAVGIVQPNVNPWKKWGGRQKDLIDDYIAMISELKTTRPEIELAVIPETALPYYFRESPFEESYLKLKQLCDSLKLPILAGAPDLEYYDQGEDAPADARIRKPTGQKYDAYNSAVLFLPELDKDTYQVYHKMKLVPGSERMPYQEHVPFIKDLIEWGVGLGSWQIGRDTLLFELDDKYLFNTAICYESVYPAFFADFVNKGAVFSVIITNDGWWGKLAGTHQHSRYAVLRAIENRRWIARCANTGISSFIDPYGNMFEVTSIGEKKNIFMNIPCIKEKTFYTAYGDLFSDSCLWITLGIAVFTAGYSRSKKTSSPQTTA